MPSKMSKQINRQIKIRWTKKIIYPEKFHSIYNDNSYRNMQLWFNMKPKLPSCKYDTLLKKSWKNAKLKLKRNRQDFLNFKFESSFLTQLVYNKNFLNKMYNFTYKWQVFNKKIQNPSMTSFITKTHFIPATFRFDFSDLKGTAIWTSHVNKISTFRSRMK